ncbi:amidohydrolase [Roseibium litorale]|uniref:Amidohydrolase n=1 Tax=Roseibium litorale TaxID=2803841 RepID=A0ABR9CWE1_9HYPH|nr:amidohydrolase [Roseibium litorale]MBD8894357.1 amidohydrolase [Roseibium litorale]
MTRKVYACLCCAADFGKFFTGNREVAKLIEASTGSQPTGFSCNAVVDRRDFVKGGVATIGALGLVGYSGGSAKAQDGTTRVFSGGTILTVDKAFSEAGAIAIKGNKILAVGSEADVRAAAGEGAEIIDLGGKVMLPGFTDPHTHIVSGSLLDGLMDYVGMARFSTATEVLDYLRDKASKAAPGEWISARNFDPSIQEGPDALTFKELDAVSKDNPVFIMNASGHLAYVNAKAYEAAGLTEDVANPPGAEYVRDESGKLNGVIKNQVAFQPVFQANPAMAAANPIQALIDLTRKWAKIGLTTVSDLGLGALSSGYSDAQLLFNAGETGKLSNRIRAYPFYPFDEAWDASPIHFGQGSALVRIAGYKLVADGSNQGYTGLQREPYLGTDSLGLAYTTSEELKRLAIKRAEQGWHLAIHGNGDAGIDNILDALEAVRDAGIDLSNVRPRIEHCSILHDDQIARMKDLGVQASFLIGHVHFWGVAMRDEVFGEEKAQLLDRAKSCEDAGVGFTLHSDFPVIDPDPLHMIEMAVTRKTWKEPAYVLAPDERISVESAIRAVTINGAWQMNSDTEVGSLEAGKLADFVILDKDPRKVDPDTIKDINVLETWMDGKQVFSA